MNILTTTLCNRKCNYCDIPTIKHKKNCDYDNFKYWIEKSKKHYNTIVLTGGEPGFLSEEYFAYVFYTDECQININTNGLWLKKYGEKYIDKTNIIVFHGFEEIDSNLNFKSIIQSHDNIYYAFLIHHKNIEFLEEMIYNNFEEFKQKENKIIFYLYDNKKLLNPDPYMLTYNDLIIIYNILKKYLPSNKIIYFLDKVIKYKDFLKTARHICNKYCIFPSIDLTTNYIKNCPNSYTNVPHVDLNDENFELLTKNELYEFEEKNPLCENCYNVIYKIDDIFKIYLKGYR